MTGFENLNSTVRKIKYVIWVQKKKVPKDYNFTKLTSNTLQYTECRF